MPLDGGEIQFEDEKKQNDEEHSLDAFMEMIKEQNNLKEEKILQQVQTSTTMAQKVFEVNNAKLTYSPSVDELHDELCDDLFNSKEKSLACLQNISFIENQIQS